MREAWFIAISDLKFMLRQRETLLWTFLIPPFVFYVVGRIMGSPGFYGLGPEFIAVQFEGESGFLGEQLVSRLEEQHLAVIRFDADAPSFGDYQLRLRIPSGFTDSVLAGEQVQLILANDGENLSGDLRTFQVNRAVYTVLADAFGASGLLTDGGRDLSSLTAEEMDSFRNGERTLTLEVGAAGRRIPIGFEQSVPGVTVMFTLFVLLTTGATSLVVERRAGILKRLASAPIGRGTVVLGKWGGKFGLAVIQVGFALLIGRVVLGVHFGPQLPMLLLTLGAYTALIASLGVLAGNLARTETQAIALGVLAAIVLAALGGCFWPIEITPGYMQQLALFMPTGWMMDAMHKLMIFGRDWDSALPHLVGMSAGAWLIGLVCARRFRFE